MANPGLVRRIADSPVGSAGEVSYSDVTEAFENSKNYIMNSNFNFFQRFGTIVTWGSNNFYVDRWFNGHTGANEISRRAVTNLPGSSTCLRYTYAGGTSNINDFYYLEDFDVNPLKGKTVTWSMYVRRTGSLNNGFRLRVGKNATPNTRTGGAWTEILSTLFLDSQIDGSGGWSLISVTFDVPNDGSANGLRVNMVNSNNVTVNGTQLEITQMMLNIGSVRAPYQPYGGSYATDLLACQRYYEKSANLDVHANDPTGYINIFPNTNVFTTSAIHGPFFFKALKRTTPTLVTYDGVGTAGRYTSLAPGGTATHNLIPADYSLRPSWWSLQVGGIGAHAGITVGFGADAEFT